MRRAAALATLGLLACDGRIVGPGAADGGADPAGDGAPAADASPARTADAAEPFSCQPASPGSPRLAAVVGFDPADPHPGDTLNVLVRATNGTSRGDAPPMVLRVDSADGASEHAPLTVEGGDAIYYFAIPAVPRGDVCVLGLVDGAAEVGARVTVTPRPPGPPADDGVYKVVANHQWTCDEQPDWGNYVEIQVLDADGVGVPGARVRVDMADTTTPPIYNDEGNIPEVVTTGADGVFVGQNYWPINANGLQVFLLSVDGAASDVATEITTGWWEDDLRGCRYCDRATVNVWGHWSYRVVFQLDPSATEACVVENDHAGMAACGEPRHIHHAPGQPACWPAR